MTGQATFEVPVSIALGGEDLDAIFTESTINHTVPSSSYHANIKPFNSKSMSFINAYKTSNKIPA